MRLQEPPRVSLAQAKKDSVFMLAYKAMVERFALRMARTPRTEKKKALHRELVDIQRRQLVQYARLLWAKKLYAESSSFVQVARTMGLSVSTLRPRILGLVLPYLLDASRWRKPKKEIDTTSPDFYFAAGLFTARGGVTYNNEVSIGIDERTREAVEPIINRLLETDEPLGGNKDQAIVRSPDLALALARNTQQRNRVPRTAFMDNPRGIAFAQGLFHASAFCNRRRGRPTQIYVWLKNRQMAEQLAVLLYKHFNILSTITPERKGKTAYTLRISHVQDLRTVHDNSLLSPIQREQLADYLQHPVRLKRDFSIEASDYDGIMRLASQDVHYSKIARNTKFSDSTVQNWTGQGKATKRVPARARSYAIVVNLAKKHGVGVPFYPHAYAHGSAQKN